MQGAGNRQLRESRRPDAGRQRQHALDSVGSQVRAILVLGRGLWSPLRSFTADDPSLLDNTIGSQTSSIIVDWRPVDTCTPGADQVALYADTNYGGECVYLGLGQYPNPGYLGSVGNDNAESIRVGSNVRAYLYENDDYDGRFSVFDADDPTLWDDTISGMTSSVKVQSKNYVAPPNPPALGAPANNSGIGEGYGVTLSYYTGGSGVEYYGEVWGGPSGTATFGWTTSTSNNLTGLAAGYQYYWKVKARNSGGESGWSETWTFQVRPATPTSLYVSPETCTEIYLTWADNSAWEDGYRVYRGGSLVAQLGPGATSFVDSGLNGSQTYSYYVQAFRGSIVSSPSDTRSTTTPACPAPDTEPPTVHWVAPVEDTQTYTCRSGTVVLEASASDNRGVQWVDFIRYNALTGQWLEIGEDMVAPYQASIDCSALNSGYNQVNTMAWDTSGNPSDSPYIWINRETNGPDLVPNAPSGFEYPIVASSVSGTGSPNTLYAGLPTYFDLHYTDSGTQVSGQHFVVEFYLDGGLVWRFTDSDEWLEYPQGVVDWTAVVSTVGLAYGQARRRCRWRDQRAKRE